MKFTGLLKEKVEAAKTKEEMRKILEENGIELTDEEVDMVSGGLPTISMSISAIETMIAEGRRNTK